MLTKMTRRTIAYVDCRRLCFDLEGKPGSGWTFELHDGEDLPRVESLNVAAYLNYLKCTSGFYSVGAPYIDSYAARSTTPGSGECTCGATVELHSSWTNTCARCGTSYNGAGQELAPVEQWGEETGEHYSDVERAESCEDYDA